MTYRLASFRTCHSPPQRRPFNGLPIRLRPLSLILLAALITTRLSGFGAATDEWHLRTPKPSTMDIASGAFGNGNYVFIAGDSDGGQIITTPDLNTWNVEFRGPQITWNSWRSVVFDGNQFVIAGEAGVILTSADGTSWEQRSGGTSLSFLAITHGNGRYVAVGEDGVSSTSTDGIAWSVSDVGDDNWYWGVAYGNNRFVTVSGGNTIYSSTDGMNWSQEELPLGAPAGYLYDITWQNGRFIAVGELDAGGGLILTSLNGTDWTLVVDADLEFGGWLNGITFDGSNYVAVGTNGDEVAVVLTSTDAVNWSITQTAFSPSHLGVFHDGNQTIVTGSYGIIATSTDLATWTRRGDGELRPATILDIAYADGTYTLVGQWGLIARSVDAANWNILPSPSSGFIRSVAYGNGKWVAANVSNEPHVMLYDFNGTWVAGTVPASVLGARSVAFGAGKFVALATTGSDPFIISSDGVNWTAVSTPGLGLYDEMVYDGGVFLAWDNPPEVLQTTISLVVATSTDGENWTEMDTGMVGSRAHGAEYANGRWVLAGRNVNDGLTGGDWRVMESADLMNWSQQNLSYGDITSGRGTLQDVTYANGQWVAVGDRHLLWVADDEPSLDWQPTFHTGMGSDNNNKFLKVISDGDSFVVAGESPFWLGGDRAELGEIYQSGSFSASLPPRLGIAKGPGAGQVRLQIQGTIGLSYDILFNESVPAPANVWQLLDTITPTQESQPYDYTIPGGQDTGVFLLRESE